MQLADLQREIDEPRSSINDADRDYQFSLAGGTLHEIREAKNRLARYRSKMGRRASSPLGMLRRPFLLGHK